MAGDDETDRNPLARLRQRAHRFFGPRRTSGSAEERLRAAEAKYRTLVEQLPLVTYIDALTETASAIYASPQVETLLGYTAEEWVGDPEFFPLILHPVPLFRHEHRAFVADENRAVGLAAGGAHRNDALGRARLRLALRQDLALSVDRVAAMNEEIRLGATHGVVDPHAATLEVDAPALAHRVRGPGEVQISRGIRRLQGTSRISSPGILSPTRLRRRWSTS